MKIHCIDYWSPTTGRCRRWAPTHADAEAEVIFIRSELAPNEQSLMVASVTEVEIELKRADLVEWLNVNATHVDA